MQHRITTVADLGVLVRAARKEAQVRIDDFAATVGMSKQFMTDLELGKPGVQLGKVLQVLEELGLQVYVDAPDSTQAQLAHSSKLIASTATRRSARADSGTTGRKRARSPNEPQS
jgi:DNA-binding XRE family transcriptional regulator